VSNGDDPVLFDVCDDNVCTDGSVIGVSAVCSIIVALVSIVDACAQCWCPMHCADMSGRCNVQPRGIMDVVRAYCNAKNLCRWCKQERHLAANQRCNAVDRPVHIPDEELRAFASSRGYSLNFRGRQLK